MRTDTTVVGAIDEGDLFFPCVLFPNNSCNDSKSIAIACTNSNDTGHVKSINFVASSIYYMLTNSWDTTPYTPVLFQGVKEPSGSFMFMALNDTTSAGGILGGIISCDNILSIDDRKSLGDFFFMDPVSGNASHYPTTLLLSALPYNVYDLVGNKLLVNIVPSTCFDRTDHYGGLATGIGCPTSGDYPLVMIPISYFVAGNCGQSTMIGMEITGIFESLYQNQCLMAPNTSYSQSSFCASGVNGFTKRYECQQGGTLYAYCNNSTEKNGCNNMLSGCGNASSYTNMLTGKQEFSMSCKGWCGEGFCISHGNDNSCQSSVNDSEKVPWWVWVILAILILVIFVLFLFIIIDDYRNIPKKKIIVIKSNA